jgi:DNA polymerase alpha subunit A
LDEDDAVYDIVDEDKYAEIVEERRKTGVTDFVVDDGNKVLYNFHLKLFSFISFVDGAGYYDDGEEVLGIADEGAKKHKLDDLSKAADHKMNKKARILAEASSAQRNSILKHVQTGVMSHAQRPSQQKSAPALLDIDSLLKQGGAPKPGFGGGMKTTFIRPPLAPGFKSSFPSFIPAPQQQPMEEEDREYEQDYSFEPSEPSNDSPTNADVKENSISENNEQQQSSEIAVKDEPKKISLMSGGRKLKSSVPVNQVTPKIEGATDFKPVKDVKSADLPSFNVAQSQSASQDSGSEFSADTSGSTKVDPSFYVKENAETKEKYLNMYWLDATEIHGDVYLIGKVLLENPSGPKKYTSCCVQVNNCERNLFVLPRVIDGEPAAFPKVYEETKRIMKKIGCDVFKCKPVKRKYAFEHSDVPREETTYLKVKYPAKKGNLPLELCSNGDTYSHIFGMSSSALELFLLKRHLMGPCWIKIKNPTEVKENKSWCKVEMQCDNPKDITRSNEGFATPPVTTLTLSMKTAVNPMTHLHEIITLSGIFHTQVNLEADTDINTKVMKRFTFIRPLGVTCGNYYPAMFPHDLKMEMKQNAQNYNEIALQEFPNERALLSMFFVKILQEDPDIFVAHNLLGFEMDVLLSRTTTLKLPNWSLLGRLRKAKPPKSVNERDSFCGRIMCDTYKAAKEFLRETSYSLTNLAGTQLKITDRQEIDPIDVPKYFSVSKDVCSLAVHTFRDSWLIFLLMLKLQVIPLTKQLTTLSGNLWAKTMKGARAERIEYLLLHEFHAQKYVLPEKKLSEFAQKKVQGKNANHHQHDDGEDEEVEGLTGKVGGMSRKRAKAAYAGGLVLEPKKGLYDTFILLLDFNSLYPSIIQEYNLCFTTMDWSRYMNDQQNNNNGKKAIEKKVKTEDESDAEESEPEADGNDHAPGNTNNGIPPLPESGKDQGILPRVIKTLVDRRREVKNLIKKEKDSIKKQELDIRQKALKLTANSMYGCLGFSFSRFYARPIAALVTAKGREALQRTVDIASNQLGLDVIYGDTDSVMINTNLTDLQAVKKLGYEVKSKVNESYKSLELDLDGIFRSMLLLKKKKYAALVVQENPDGTFTCEKEMKGLDLVRRDWCPLSKEAGKYTVDQILSGKPCEEIVLSIHDYLSELAGNIRQKTMPLEKFVITKGLNKNPKDYPDCSGQAHLQVALAMLKANKPVNIGDHIPYVICLEGTEGATAPQRAIHPDELIRDPEKHNIDFEWYISNQLLPPISRLCEPIQGTSALILSEKLGLDTSKYANTRGNGNDDLMDDSWGFTPRCQMDDNERFKGCVPLSGVCGSCKASIEVHSLLSASVESNKILACSKCHEKYLGRG